jgi:hypothetical protein
MKNSTDISCGGSGIGLFEVQMFVKLARYVGGNEVAHDWLAHNSGLGWTSLIPNGDVANLSREKLR